MSDEIKLENRIEKFFNDNDEEVPIEEATYKYVTIYKPMSTEIEIQYEVDIIDGVDQEWVEAEEYNDNREPAGSPKGGQFASKGTVSEEFQDELRKKVKPNPKMKELQKEVDEEITDKVWQAIDELGIRDKIHDVAMQGSFAKGTDLPVFEGDIKGSDLDLFVIFKSDVDEKDRNELGVKIGMKALEGKNPYIQNATSEYAEAFFDHKGEKMEVQVVPTRHLTREQIENKEYNGETISVGMERTPHQTEFMKKNLTPEMQEQTRMLKKFMKETGLYDSSMKSQGFSGYATEALIYNLGTFDNVIDYFANFKKGDVLNKTDRETDLGKGNDQNPFSLIDPIDKNRDLISAFSPLKIGRTILTAKALAETGKPPTRSKPVKLKNSITLSYNTSENNEDTLAGQIRKTQNSIINVLEKNGFIVPNNPANIEGLHIDVHRVSQDRDNDNIILNFGFENMDIPPEYPQIVSPKADLSKIKARLETSVDGVTTAWRKRKYTNAKEMMEALIRDPSLGLKSSGVTTDMRKGTKVQVNPDALYENII